MSSRCTGGKRIQSSRVRILEKHQCLYGIGNNLSYYVTNLHLKLDYVKCYRNSMWKGAAFPILCQKMILKGQTQMCELKAIFIVSFNASLGLCSRRVSFRAGRAYTWFCSSVSLPRAACVILVNSQTWKGRFPSPVVLFSAISATQKTNTYSHFSR